MLRAPFTIILAALIVAFGPIAWAEPVAERLAPDLIRWFPNEASRAAPVPFPAYVQPLSSGEMLAESPAVEVIFQQAHGRHAARIDIAEGTSLYGTGEVAGPLLRNGQRTVAWNTDAYGYGRGSLSLYQSHPWVLAVRADGSSFGVLAETTWRCLIDLSGGILLAAEGPAFPIVIIEGDRPQDVLRALARLTGTIELPPRWALGYHQCRYSYTPEARVREIAAGFRQRRIPCDVIWLDIDYMDGYRSFTWNAESFPDPKGLIDDLHEQGFRSIAILDPGIKWEPGHRVFESGGAVDAWVRAADGGLFTGVVWPGICVFPDFTRGAVRRWWSELVVEFLDVGLDGLWNDMNEPAVFQVESKTMPEDNLHRADPELGGPGSHARYHNVYGMLMARASYEGMQRARPGRRPFVLTRAGFLGEQRWAATWTGDNTTSWDHLDMSISMVLNLGLSGQPFSGPDIGGFRFGGDGTLFGRWMGIGALLPFARGHTEKGGIDKEPWSFGPATETVCRLALERRSRLMPYLYTVFQEASTQGLPVCRPAFFADPVNPELRAEDDSFLLGADVAVIARTHPTEPINVPTTFESWRPFALVGVDRAHPELPQFRLRPGAILPVGPIRQYVDEDVEGLLELIVHLNDSGRATGWLYDDDGTSLEHLSGAFHRTRFDAELQRGELVVSMDSVEGDGQRPVASAFVVRWLLPQRDVIHPVTSNLPISLSASRN
jgi:alpha-glucosidase